LELGDPLARDGCEVDQLVVDPDRVEVEHEGVATGHAGREVAPGRSEDDHTTAGHVLATVVTDALDHRGQAGVADAEALADLARQEDLARGAAVADRVAGDDLLAGVEGGLARGTHDDPTSGESLADVVVAV